MKNITLSADEALIQRARRRAQREGTTLNEAFRQWLHCYVAQEMGATSYASLMKELEYATPGRRFTREEMNER